MIFSVLLYNYIKITIYEDISNDLLKEAEYIKANHFVSNKYINPFKSKKDISFNNTLLGSLGKTPTGLKVAVTIKPGKKKYFFEQTTRYNKIYLVIYYPLDTKTHRFLKVSKDITDTEKLFNRVRKAIFVGLLVTMFFIIFYALFLTQNLLNPITLITDKLSKMNEAFLKHIDLEGLPDEFRPLGVSVNKLIDRIQTFIKYQKELFIGVAHELKTPLAVMKTKNEVTMLRKREPEKYKEVLKLNNQTIDEMNKMISNILEIG
ncbi:MAG: HAMP domain-containing histidine kinase, partial [Epsilonproteobacteria bacterium]|nr:HAMP domain-containing histidine kinase [Campylobacterota bacterium]